MEVNRLNQDEFGYELAIRGLSVGKVDEMRTSLRSLRAVEKEGKVLVVDPYPFKFEEDIEALDRKMLEIRELLSAFAGEAGSNEYRKLVTKIEWALGRLGRVVAADETQKKEKSRIRADLILAFGSLQLKANGEDDEDDSSEVAEEMSMTAAAITSAHSRVPLYKWDLKFSGDAGQSVNSFIERVQELADARGVNKLQLFRSALDLFSGRALVWYRANKTMFHAWSDLVRELRKEFLPADYDDRLMEEIKRRTQGKDETIGMYVAMMTTMFSRLTVPMPESQQLRILKRNISPFYQTQLGLTEIWTVQDLVELGRRLESVRFSVEAFIPPPSRRNQQLLEPDLAYVASEIPVATVAADDRVGPNNSRLRRCYRCGKPGHVARVCNQALRCFGCGSPGVIRPNCGKCNPTRLVPQNSNGNARISNKSGNASGARA